MKNYVCEGRTFTIAAAVALASGDMVLAGHLFGVASTDAAIGDSVDIQSDGVFDLPKAAVAIAQGDRLYYDATNTCLTNVVANLPCVGVAHAAAAEAATTVNAKLGGVETEAGSELFGSAALDFASIAAAASEDKTITVTGAAVGDKVVLGLPAAPAAGLIFQAFVSAADTVTVRATNVTGSAVDAASATYKVEVSKQ